MTFGKRNTSVIIVDYNSGDDTARLVESLGHVRDPARVHLTIVDNVGNGYSVERLEQVSRNASQVQVLTNPANSGYLGGFNFGIADALENSDAWLVLCNADIVFIDPDFFDKLDALELCEDIVCIAPSIMTQADRNQNPFLMRSPSRIRMLFYSIMFCSYLSYLALNILNDFIKLLTSGRGRKPLAIPPSMTPIYAPHGSCIILNKRYFEHYERLDDTLLIWGEEIIIAETVRQMNGKVVFVPDLKVLHNESGGISALYGRFSYKTYRILKEVNRYLGQEYIGYESR